MSRLNRYVFFFRKECGLEKFVPMFERSTMRGKDLRKLLTQQLKINQNLTAPGQKQLTALQAKLHYMKIVSEQKTFGSRVFMVTLLVCSIFTLVYRLNISFYHWDNRFFCKGYIRPINKMTAIIKIVKIIPVNLQQLLSGRSPTFQLSKVGDFARRLFWIVYYWFKII